MIPLRSEMYLEAPGPQESKSFKTVGMADVNWHLQEECISIGNISHFPVLIILGLPSNRGCTGEPLREAHEPLAI